MNYDGEENDLEEYGHFLKQRTTDDAIGKRLRQAKARKTTKKGTRVNTEKPRQEFDRVRDPEALQERELE